MNEVIENTECRLTVPDKEVLPKLTIADLHKIWRENEKALTEAVDLIGAENIPLVASHGSTAERIVALSTCSHRTIWVAITQNKFTSTRDALKNLYVLASCANNYSFRVSNKKGPIKGEGGAIFFIMNPLGPPYTFNNKWPITVGQEQSNLLHPIPYYCRKPREGEPANYYGYVIEEPLDNADEQLFFNMKKDPDSIIASDAFIIAPHYKRIAIMESDSPMHYLTDHDPEPVIDSYRTHILNRLFYQSLVARILPHIS